MKWIKLATLPIVLMATLGIYVLTTQEHATMAHGASAEASSSFNSNQQNGRTLTGLKPNSKNRPDFANISDVNQKKQTFFEYMLPMIRQANAAIMAQRETVLSLQKKFSDNETLNGSDQKALEELLNFYHVEYDNEITQAHFTELLNRCDIVPAGLVLAQSANESAWGTSRFAVKANNFFGLWCFQRGCGLKPSERDDDNSHEVAKFDSVNHGVRYYVKTINTHYAYENLRKIRSDLRRENINITGTVLAEGLLPYSERGHAYVKEIQSMIRFNKLSRYSLDTRA